MRVQSFGETGVIRGDVAVIIDLVHLHALCKHMPIIGTAIGDTTFSYVGLCTERLRITPATFYVSHAARVRCVWATGTVEHKTHDGRVQQRFQLRIWKLCVHGRIYIVR